jgi:hypothetical protein
MGRLVLLAFALTVVWTLFAAVRDGAITADFLNDIYVESIEPVLAPEDSNQEKPEDTLVSPFAAGLPEPIAKETKDLSVPHVLVSDVSDFVTEELSELFTIDPQILEEHLNKMSDSVSEGAKQDFSDFLVEINLVDVLTNNNTVINTFVEEIPELLKEGAFKERYRWVFKVPITLTEIDRGVESYEELDRLNREESSFTIMAQAQVGREAEGGVNGLIIERLKLSIRR